MHCTAVLRRSNTLESETVLYHFQTADVLIMQVYSTHLGPIHMRHMRLSARVSLLAETLVYSVVHTVHSKTLELH